MSQPIYTIGDHSLGFCIESIRQRYPNAQTFALDMLSTHADIEQKALKKLLDKVGKEAFPTPETNQEGAQ